MKIITLLLLSLFLFTGCKRSDVIDNIFGANALHNRPVGASANEILDDSKYRSLVLEIQYMTGYAPDAAAIAHLQSFLESRLNKPDGITIVTREISPAGQAVMSLEDVISTENQNRTKFTSGNEIALYILYTNGSYSAAGTLGIAYRNTSAVLFGKKIHENSGGLGQVSRTKLEATVLEHEAGHLLGLVDLGTPMQIPHRDASHGHHCSNSQCLMYHTAETTDILGLLLTGAIPALDNDCISDLQANGGL